MSGQSTTGSFRGQGSKSSGTKILRACVVQSGKIIEEQRLRKKAPLTVGRGPKNTFVIADGAMPKTHRLFALRAGKYELVVTPEMAGKISVDGGGAPQDLEELKNQGKLKKKGEYFYMPLGDGHRGKVMLGDTTIIFQFVVPPPVPVKPVLPAAAKGSIWNSLDWQYMAILLLVTLIEVPAFVYLHYVPAQEKVTLDTMDERWVNLIAPNLERKKIQVPKKKDKNAQKQAAKSKDKQEEKVDEPQDDAKKAKAKAAKSKKIRENIAGKGILAILGTRGAGGSGGAVADVLGDGGIGGDLDGAFEGIAGVGMATAGSGGTKRGGGSGEAASIGGLATSGGGKVGLGNKKEKKVGTVRTGAPDVDGDLSPAQIVKVVKRNLRSITACYEQELKRDPGLSGKIEVEFTIDERGRVESAEIVGNGLGSKAVGSCIVARVRRWRFPAPDGGSVTAAYPFIFSPSN